MSRIFKRPMFRKGGPTNNMNGIMSGIVDRENHAVSDEMGVGGQTARERLLALYDQTPDKSIDPLSQFLIQGGLNLMSATPRGGTLATAAEAFKQPTGQLFQDLGAKEKARRKIAMEGEILDIERGFEKEQSQLEGQIKKDVAQIQQRGNEEVKKELLDNKFALLKKQAEGDPEKLKQLDEQYNREFDQFVIKGLDLSDLTKVIGGDEITAFLLERATNYVENVKKLSEGDPGYDANLTAALAAFQNQYMEQLKQSFASGGRVNYAIGTPKTGATQSNLVNQQKQSAPAVTVGNKEVTSDSGMNISYDELRSRLPEQISNEVVKVLSTSYEALADFAELQTQADVDAFNNKYRVNLVLPQEA
jgi:hypothetical protein